MNYIEFYIGFSRFFKDLNAEARLIYCYIYSWYRQKKPCFASHHYLAEITGSAVSTVQRTINELVDKGFIKKENTSGNRKALYILKDISKNITEQPERANERQYDFDEIEKKLSGDCE